MPYFSSESARDKAKYYQSNSQLKVRKSRYSADYAGAFKVIESKSDEEILRSFSDGGEASESKRSASYFKTACNSLLLLTAFMLATHFTSVSAPRYFEDAFLGIQGWLTPIYEDVYARAVSAGDEVDVSRETIDAVGEAGQASETGTGDAQEESSLQRMVLEAAKKSEGSSEVEVSAGQKFDVVFEDTSGSEAIGGIISKDLSVGTDRIYSVNETKLSPDLNALAVAQYPLEPVSGSEDEAQVLIIHTHGTECYSDSADGASRSIDREENVVRVGKELAEVLNFHGITTVHSETMHDEKSYLTAYSSSKKEVQRLLELYPTVQYVIDLHRDALPSDGKSRVKTSTVINGEETAQVMLVIGTNAGGGNHPNYEKNLTVASHIQLALNDLYPTLARPINIRNAVFNQAFTPGCLLLEVGSDANTLEEALRAARMFGEALARVAKGV